MSSINAVAVEQLARLIGTPKCPALIDVRSDEDFAADPRLLPGAPRRSHAETRQWAQGFSGRPVMALALTAVIAVFRFKGGMLPALAACSVAGVLLYAAGASL